MMSCKNMFMAVESAVFALAISEKLILNPLKQSKLDYFIRPAGYE